MNNLPNDLHVREFYETFSADHDRHREALMKTVFAEETLVIPKRANRSSREWQRTSRRVLVGMAAIIVVALSLPFVLIGFETKPATTLPDGWRQEIPVNADKMTAAADNTALVEIWTEEGWLIACRKSPEGEIEWQVVLAKTDAAEAPKVAQTPDELTVTFGSYSVRDASSGSLRICRQPKKSRDEWPTLDLETGKQKAAAGNWRGVIIAGRQIDDWIWATSGPSDRKNGLRSDIWLRLEHHTPKMNVSYGASSGIFSIQFFFGPRKATDDGRQFTANRVMTADVANATQNF